jgi:hypothetical protein
MKKGAAQQPSVMEQEGTLGSLQKATSLLSAKQ